MTAPEFNYGEREAHARGYRVTEMGTLLNPRGRTVGGSTTREGYRRFRFEKNGKCVFVHRLAAFQWFGDEIYRTGMVVRHLDGNKQNCSRANLALGTDLDNARDITPSARSVISRRMSASLRRYDYGAIQSVRQSGASIAKIRAMFGIGSSGTVSYIINHAQS